MPYYLNCIRCNADNLYSSLGKDCGKCGGTGRDWRGDLELSGYHDWAGLEIEDLKKQISVSVIHGQTTFFFNYAEVIPKCSLAVEIEQIKREVSFVELAVRSQIFCKHDWKRGSHVEKEICTLCEKTRLVKNSDVQIVGRELNKTLHDTKRYFPNKCFACDHYESTNSEHGNPVSGSDIVYCSIGGEVRADTGCEQFYPDVTAGCDDCWNFLPTIDGDIRIYNCDILGKLSQKVQGGCKHHVEKEETY